MTRGIARPLCAAVLAAVLFGDPTLAGRQPSPPALAGEFEHPPRIVQLPDGALAGFSLALEGGQQRVVMQTSSDQSRTWSDPQVVLDLPAEPGNWSGPEVLVDRHGEIHLALINDAHTGIIRTGEATPRPPTAERTLNLWHTKSSAGRTEWRAPRKIWDGYTGALNSFIQTRAGKLILPFSFRTKRSWRNRGGGFNEFTYMGDFSSTVIHSDDDGETWQLSPDALMIPTPDIRGAYGAVEPVVVELKDGRVWMLIRSQMGRFYESFSKDGARWSPAQPTSIISSDSPAGIVRLPDGRLVMLWNECLRYPYAYGGRQVLHGAVSEDEGRTWRGHREVMRDPQRGVPPPPSGDFGTAYPYPLALQNGQVIFTSGQGHGRRASYLLDPAWLYETRQAADFSRGLEEWSVYGTRGVDVITAQEGNTPVLQVRKSDAAWPAGAVWNFPYGTAGIVQIEFQLQAGAGAVNVGLTDHYSTPFDAEDVFYNLFNLHLQPGATRGGARLQENRWYTLLLEWDTERRHCRVSLDGRVVATLQQTREATGVNYLRFRALGSGPTRGGLLVRAVSADVSRSWEASSAAAAAAGPEALPSAPTARQQGD